MRVRCWVILGDQFAAQALPPERDLGMGRMAMGPSMPDAKNHAPGDWTVWCPDPEIRMTLLCVEIPLA